MAPEVLNRRSMRGVVVVVGAVAIAAIGLIAASLMVEPAPASGGASSSMAASPITALPAVIGVPTTDRVRGQTGSPGEQHPSPAEESAVVPAIESKGGVTKSSSPIASQASGPTSGSTPPASLGTDRRPLGLREELEHLGPEAPSANACSVPIYSWGRVHRAPIRPADVNDLYVRVTVENYTNTWRFDPDKQGTTYLKAVEDLATGRVYKGEDGKPYVRFASIRIGARELKYQVLPFSFLGTMEGGLFGAQLLDAFNISVDWDRAELVFNDCLGQ